jgi:DNA ligase-1
MSLKYEKISKLLKDKKQELSDLLVAHRNMCSAVTFMCWDNVDFSSTKPYADRFVNVKKTDTDNIRFVDTFIVNDEDEANEFYSTCISEGHEGAVLKNINSLWVPKRSKDLGKMKAVEEADLIVVGYVGGKGKYVGMLGKLLCETSDGKVHVGVGSGWSDEERATLTEKNTKGRILTVLYNQKVSDKSGTWSLFLPRKVEFRDDKDIANSFDELK